MVVPASRRKIVLLLLISIGFGLAGWFMLSREPWIAWIGLVFGGLGGATSSLFLAFPRFWALELADDGFRMRSLFGTVFIRWQDVTVFEVGSISMNTMVVFNYAPSYQGQKFGRMVASDLAGWQGAIADIYGIRPVELAALLNEWKRRSEPNSQVREGKE